VSGSRVVLLPLLLVVGALLRGGIMLLLSAEDGWEEAKEWDDCIMVLINKLVCGCGGRRLALAAWCAPGSGLRLSYAVRIPDLSGLAVFCTPTYLPTPFHSKPLHVAVATLTRGKNLFFVIWRERFGRKAPW